MPYLGQDWRSPGDQWVKTKEGWERLKLWRLKIFENLNSHFLARLLRLALAEWGTQYKDLQNQHQPYIHFIRTTSRERKVLTSISEAFVHLDLSGACHDPRRFNYVCNLLQLLIRHKLGDMSGSSQKYIFNILEEMVSEVLKTEYNVAVMKKLVSSAALSLDNSRYSHIGSSCLWNNHMQCVIKMSSKLNQFKVKERKEDGRASFGDLPKDCVRIILSKIPDHKDIVCLGQTNSENHELSEDLLLWKQMCFFHFTNRQLLTFIAEDKDELEIDWKYVYKRCMLRFGMKDVYADMLAICTHCNNIFWQSIGHPCISQLKPHSQPLKPDAFLKLFQF